MKTKQKTTTTKKKKKTAPTKQKETLREAQKALTRSRILSAAGDLFFARGYGVVTVDDVVAEAGIGRATFYLHFSSKTEVMGALLDGLLPGVHARYDALLALPAWGVDDVRGWVRDFFAFYREHRVVISASTQAEASDLAWSHGLLATSRQLVARFAPPSSTSPADQVRALLLIEELDRVAYFVAVRGWDVDEDAAVDVVAGHWFDFLRRR